MAFSNTITQLTTTTTNHADNFNNINNVLLANDIDLDSRILELIDKASNHYSLGYHFAGSQEALDSLINVLPDKLEAYNYDMVVNVGFSNNSIMAAIGNTAGGQVGISGNVSQDRLFGYQQANSYSLGTRTIQRTLLNGVWSDWTLPYNILFTNSNARLETHLPESYPDGVSYFYSGTNAFNTHTFVIVKTTRRDAMVKQEIFRDYGTIGHGFVRYSASHQGANKNTWTEWFSSSGIVYGGRFLGDIFSIRVKQPTYYDVADINGIINAPPNSNSWGFIYAEPIHDSVTKVTYTNRRMTNDFSWDGRSWYTMLSDSFAANVPTWISNARGEQVEDFCYTKTVIVDSPDNMENKTIDIEFDGAVGGRIELTVYGGFFNSNSSGYVQKEYNFAASPGLLLSSTSRYINKDSVAFSEFRLSDILFDTASNKAKITIKSLKNTSNNNAIIVFKFIEKSWTDSFDVENSLTVSDFYSNAAPIVDNDFYLVQNEKTIILPTHILNGWSKSSGYNNLIKVGDIYHVNIEITGGVKTNGTVLCNFGHTLGVNSYVKYMGSDIGLVKCVINANGNISLGETTTANLISINI